MTAIFFVPKRDKSEAWNGKNHGLAPVVLFQVVLILRRNREARAPI